MWIQEASDGKIDEEAEWKVKVRQDHLEKPVDVELCWLVVNKMKG